METFAGRLGSKPVRTAFPRSSAKPRRRTDPMRTPLSPGFAGSVLRGAEFGQAMADELAVFAPRSEVVLPHAVRMLARRSTGIEQLRWLTKKL
jgi:hypothetical protein